MLHLSLFEAIAIDETPSKLRRDEPCVVHFSADVTRFRVFLGTAEVVHEVHTSVGGEWVVIPRVRLAGDGAIVDEALDARAVDERLAQSLEERSHVASVEIRQLEDVLAESVLELRVVESLRKISAPSANRVQEPKGSVVVVEDQLVCV